MSDLYGTPESRLDTIIGANSPLWSNIGRVYKDYQDKKQYDSIEPSFDNYLFEEFSIQVKKGEDGYIWEYDVKDPAKYTFFLLKYAS
jgi:hypothetical protein